MPLEIGANLIEEIEHDVDVGTLGQSPAKTRVNDALTSFDRPSITKIIGCFKHGPSCRNERVSRFSVGNAEMFERDRVLALRVCAFFPAHHDVPLFRSNGVSYKHHTFKKGCPELLAFEGDCNGVLTDTHSKTGDP
jgi:hypothetical protein